MSKEKIRLFGRSFYISLVVILCIVFGAYGTARAYSGIRLIGFGEYRKAIEAENGVLKILDFELETD